MRCHWARRGIPRGGAAAARRGGVGVRGCASGLVGELASRASVLRARVRDVEIVVRRLHRREAVGPFPARARLVPYGYVRASRTMRVLPWFGTGPGRSSALEGAAEDRGSQGAQARGLRTRAAACLLDAPTRSTRRRRRRRLRATATRRSAQGGGRSARAAQRGTTQRFGCVRGDAYCRHLL